MTIIERYDERPPPKKDRPRVASARPVETIDCEFERVTDIEKLGAAQDRVVIRLGEVMSARVRRNSSPVYRVRPAPDGSGWFCSGSNAAFLEITRLFDGRKAYVRSREIRVDDIWAHEQFVRWERECQFWARHRRALADDSACVDIAISPACLDVLGHEPRVELERAQQIEEG